jgi:hypothetical protein
MGEDADLIRRWQHGTLYRIALNLVRNAAPRAEPAMPSTDGTRAP